MFNSHTGNFTKSRCDCGTAKVHVDKMHVISMNILLKKPKGFTDSPKIIFK